MSDTFGSRLQELFDAALESYEKHTGMKLIDHPLARRLENCHTVDDIMDVLQQQAGTFARFRGADDKVKKSLKRVVHILHTLSTSTTLGEGVGLSFPPAKAIFAGFSILLTAIKDVNSSHDALLELLETMEYFLNRLEVYTELPTTAAMGEIIVKIIVELLSTIALVTKQIKQKRPLKLVKKLLGDNEVEAVLQRLDRLTLEETRMTAVQTLGVVHGLVRNMAAVMADGKPSSATMWDALRIMQDSLNELNESQRKKSQREARQWLSPPDPWKNHNTARELHHDGTSSWFVGGDAFAKWKSSGPDSLLWMHGKPGAGKSIVCSTIIENIDNMRKRGLASLGFFYCDFRDDDKKTLRGLVSSLLVQLCDHSDAYSAILSKFYSAHSDGSRQASDNALIGCLGEILKHPGQAPVYVIIDGLDECPNAFGMPSDREKVLTFVEELVDLHLQNLRICISSRSEVDITNVLDPLHFRTVILHEERGQMQDIVNYINSVVNTDRRMKNWRAEDKELVIEMLTTKSQGMFRWAFCQLEFLRQCLPARIRQALDELPESLDGTYERILQGINKANWKYAQRIFRCVSVTPRPLLVEELVEVLAFDFDTGPTPMYRADWRPVDPVGALLSTCSSLLVVVKVDGLEVIEFSHFSVKEYLTSTRLSESSDPISRYHVSMTLAHTLVAQVCLGILLHLDEPITSDSLKGLPFATYAARNWMDHARFTGVSASTQDGTERLFDPRNSHLAIWVWIFDPDTPWRQSPTAARPLNPRGSSLHYAALLGLHELARFLVIERSQDVNAVGLLYNRTPLHAASRGGHVELARILLEHGAGANAQDDDKWTPLHVASLGGHVELAQMLIRHGADVDAQDNFKTTPLRLAFDGGHVEFARMLIEHGADMNAQGYHQKTLLHLAAEGGHVRFARALIEHDADVNAQDYSTSTPLHLASKGGHVDFAQLLVEHGADLNVQDNDKSTPLSLALKGGNLESARLLVEYGADVNVQNNDKLTPLLLALKGGNVDFARVLIEHGADVNVQGDDKSTPLHLTFDGGHMELASVLIEHGADVDVRDNRKLTLLLLALKAGNLEFARLLVEHGADVNVEDNDKLTPLHLAFDGKHLQFSRLLIEHGADVNARDNWGLTLLHLALKGGNMEFARLLVEHGADVNVQGDDKSTPLHLAFDVGYTEFVSGSIEHGADVSTQDNRKLALLLLALKGGNLEFARLLVEHGADVNVKDNDELTPLHIAFDGGHMQFAQLLIEHGADVNARDNRRSTLFLLASKVRDVQMAQVLYSPGLSAYYLALLSDPRTTPLSRAFVGRYVGFSRALIERGADVNARYFARSTLLHFASRVGDIEFARMLIEHGADVNVWNSSQCTPFMEARRERFYNIMKLLQAHGAVDDSTW